MTKPLFDFYIDRGGTFTDVYFCITKEDKAEEGVLKLLSEDPANYSDAPREAIKRITDAYSDFAIRTIRMGTTVSTNALLERKGARTAFLATKGFKDLLEIGYQNRPKIFDLNIKKVKQLYTTVVELDERIYLDDSIKPEFNAALIKDQLLALKDQSIESLAIALIHSYKDASHELKVKKLAQDIGFTEITLSSELVPMIKYVPRASTTVIDAYLAPTIKKYIENFKSGFLDGLKDTELLFMKSDGSLCDETEFRGFNSILSGPAGGVTALKSVYQNTNDVNENFEDESSTVIEHPRRALIGFDMGGTSTDISRFDGKQILSFDSEIEGLLLQSPQLDINTIAAGGGSRLFYENGLFRVGPESAGSHPGPVSYKKNGYLSITDANLVLGKLDPKFFPKVFGENADETLDYDLAYKAFNKLINENNLAMSVEEVAQGFIQVANETMARPIREVSSAKGFDVKNHDLVCFGGAAAQHAVGIARILGIENVVVHKYSGILSAYGISLANKALQKQKAFGKSLSCKKEILQLANDLIAGFTNEGSIEKSLNLRYQGTDTKFLIEEPVDGDYSKVFEQEYLREFGFNLNREIICDDIIVKQVIEGDLMNNLSVENSHKSKLEQISTIRIYIDSKWHQAPVYNFNDLTRNSTVIGPALIMQDTATIVLEPGSRACLDDQSNLIIKVETQILVNKVDNNPINLAIFSNRFMSIAEQMGKTLERTSISTNIKERRDFSCAVFNKEGDLIANAPHQPVHLGSMGYAVKKQIEKINFKPGDAILTNHPVMGGSHLPDLTVITPVFSPLSSRGATRRGELLFFVANRAHHADIGGISPGSMPSFSKKLSEEGIAIKSFKILQKSVFQEDSLRTLFSESRLLDDNISDLRAQVAANNQGINLIEDLMHEYSLETVLSFMDFILENSQKVVEEMISRTVVKDLVASDFMDDGSKIKLKISRSGTKAVFDFTGSAKELDSNLNTPVAVLSSAILYCLRAIIDKDIPLNQGFLRPIEIIVPEKSMLNPSENKAVVAGNVQTSQRIVDVIFKAFNSCAASQGCMNNLIFGNQSFGYYETIGGGAGASMIKGLGFNGASGVHTHMTNTRITDPEILESRYPVILKEFSIRKNSGGQGKFKGGNGLVRHFKFLDELDLSLLTERRVYSPYGLEGGKDGSPGENWLYRVSGKEEKLASKVSLKLESGDELKILTPGGGGYLNNEK